MKAIHLLFVATAIQTTLSQVSQVIFTPRLRIPSASVRGQSIDADRTPSDSSTGLETSPRELIEFTSMSFHYLPDAGAGGTMGVEFTSMSFLQLPDAGVSGTMGAKSVKNTKSPTVGGTVAKSAKGTKSPTAGKSAKGTKSPTAGKSAKSASATISTTTSAADSEVEPVKSSWSSKMVIATAAGVSAALVAAIAVAVLTFKRR